MADQSQIDPRLFASASSVPPRAQQLYSSAPQQNSGHPYYLPSPTAQHHSQSQQLSQSAPLGSILDPALEQTSPTAPDADHHDDGHEDEDDHDGYVAGAISHLPRRCSAAPLQRHHHFLTHRSLYIQRRDLSCPQTVRVRFALAMKTRTSSGAVERQIPAQHLTH